MKKISLLLFILLFAFAFRSFSQDILYKTDGTKEQVKITMVSDKEIQYKKFNNPDGPVYSIPKKDILMITYENGDYEMMKSADSEKKAAKAELAENFTKNLISYHLFDVVYGDFTFSYERILASGIIGIKIPVGIGYAYSSGLTGFNDNRVYNLIYSGLGVNFYPTGQGKWRYFVGPNIRVGYGKMVDTNSGYYDEYGNWIQEDVSHEGLYTKFFMDNGVMFTPIRNFSVAAIVGVGVRYFPEANNSTVLPTGYFSINMSYRF
jgi:hypothetical protein